MDPSCLGRTPTQFPSGSVNPLTRLYTVHIQCAHSHNVHTTTTALTIDFRVVSKPQRSNIHHRTSECFFSSKKTPAMSSFLQRQDGLRLLDYPAREREPLLCTWASCLSAPCFTLAHTAVAYGVKRWLDVRVWFTCKYRCADICLSLTLTWSKRMIHGARRLLLYTLSPLPAVGCIHVAWFLAEGWGATAARETEQKTEKKQSYVFCH